MLFHTAHGPAMLGMQEPLCCWWRDRALTAGWSWALLGCVAMLPYQVAVQRPSREQDGEVMDRIAARLGAAMEQHRVHA